MAKKQSQGHTAVIGMNVGTDSGEVRYDIGDDVAAEHVEQWMIDDGAVECAAGCHTKSSVEVADTADTDAADPADDLIEAQLDEAELARQEAEALDALKDGA